MRRPILVVDDNAINVELLLHLLESHGHVVQAAYDAFAALDAVRQERPGLILMDMQMPGMNGYDLTRHLKSDPATAAIPIIAVTSYALSGDRQTALSAGCDDHISKPIDTRALPGIVARFIPGRSAAADSGA